MANMNMNMLNAISGFKFLCFGERLGRHGPPVNPLCTALVYHDKPNCCEGAATLIVTGFLWSMWPSRLGQYYYRQAISDLEIRPGWLAGYG